MQYNKNIVKMVLFLALYVQTYDILAKEIEDEGGVVKHDEESDVYKLYLLAKKHVEEYKEKGIQESPNFNSIGNRLNECVKMFEKETEGSEVVPVIFLIGVLRKCNFDNIKGFEDIKALDLDKCIVDARAEGYFNSFSVQRKSEIFRKKYWEI